LFAGPKIVAVQGIFQIRREEKAYHLKSSRASAACVSCPVSRERVGIVDHEGFSVFEASGELLFLARTRALNVEADMYMRVRKTLPVEGGLSGSLWADKDDRFHCDGP